MITNETRAHALQYEWIPDPSGRACVCLRAVGNEQLVYEPIEVALERLWALEEEILGPVVMVNGCRTRSGRNHNYEPNGDMTADENI